MTAQAMLHPCEVELETRERLSEFIVQLARDTRALFFSHGLQPSRKRAQLLA